MHMPRPPSNLAERRCDQQSGRVWGVADRALRTPQIHPHAPSPASSSSCSFAQVDVHHVFNHVLAREFGAFQTCELDAASPDLDAETVGQDKTSLVRSTGLSVRRRRTAPHIPRGATNPLDPMAD